MRARAYMNQGTGRRALRRLRFELRSAVDVVGYRWFDRIDVRRALLGRRRMPVGAGYDVWATHYDRQANPIASLEAEGVQTLLADLSFRTVLDAACGTGRHTLRLAASGKAVTALDMNEAMLEVLQRNAESSGYAVSTAQGDLHGALPFAERTFDLVLCMLAFEHLEDVGTALGEFHRVLRPGGHVLYSTLHPEVIRRGGGVGFSVRDTHYVIDTVYRSEEEYLRLTRAAGFSAIRTEVLARRMAGVLGGLLPPVPACLLVRGRREDSPPSGVS